MITIDGGTGTRDRRCGPLVPPQINEDFQTVLEWADDMRRLKVRANADNPEDAAGHGSSARRASASAAPSTCSSATSGCRSSRR